MKDFLLNVLEGIAGVVVLLSTLVGGYFAIWLAMGGSV